MTIELGDGLQFNELLEILEALDVTKLLSPELRNDLLNGTNALLSLVNFIQTLPPFLLGLLPGGAPNVDGATKTLQLVKGLLE